MTSRQGPAKVRREFGKEFYDRFYHRSSTAVASTQDAHRLCKFVMAYLDFLGLEVARVLDAGCGLGHWQSAFRRLRRRVEYVGIETSDYLCERYGWRKSTIAEFRTRGRFDLVVCQDVLQYLNDEEAANSIANLARQCRGAMYFEVPTREDFESGALDTRRTDGEIYTRPANWYRKRLLQDFDSAGGGVFVRKNSGLHLLALEKL
jgi:SAM-dependent methyltransferase